MKTKKRLTHLLWFIPLLAVILYLSGNQQKTAPYQQDSGFIFGTMYTITYQYKEDLKQEIEEELKRFDASLSPFNDASVISKVNRNEDVTVDTLFKNVFNRSMEISEETRGAFDITVAPLVNAWGFGFKKGEWPDSIRIDSLLEITGYKNISLAKDKVVKKDPRIMITCSAIAKGYATDVIAQLLQRKGIKNYMVDIGGELVLKGENPRKEKWRIGINKPIDDSLAIHQEMQLVLQLTDAGIATSGNYHNYHYKDGKKYAHIIDPRTGYPVQHSILSATVVAKDCMTADALATAFMVMGIDEAKAFAVNHPDIDVCFIYSDKQGDTQTYITENLKKQVVNE